MCAVSVGLEPQTICQRKTIQAVVHNRRTIGQEDKRETTVKQYNSTSTVKVKLLQDGWMDLYIYI